MNFDQNTSPNAAPDPDLWGIHRPAHSHLNITGYLNLKEWLLWKSDKTDLISCCEEAWVILESLLYQLTEAVKQSQQLLHILFRVLDKHTHIKNDWACCQSRPRILTFISHLSNMPTNGSFHKKYKKWFQISKRFPLQWSHARFIHTMNVSRVQQRSPNLALKEKEQL